jgi:outer membrane lipoprotein-sorting protein
MKNLHKILAGAMLIVSSHAMAQEDVKANEILEQHVKAIGGKEKIAAIKSIKIKQIISANGSDIPQELTIVPGESMRTEINAMGNKMIVCISGNEGWQSTGTQTQTLPAEYIKSMKSQTDVFGPLVNHQEAKIQVTFVGIEKLNKKEEAYKLKLKDKDGNESEAYISTKDYMFVKMTSKGTDILFLDYKNYDGIKMPQVIEMVSANGKVVIADREVTINPKIEEDTFKMPSK